MITEETKTLLVEEAKAVKQITYMLKGSVENLMGETVKCKELQNIIMDLTSVEDHCDTLLTIGPSDPYIDVDQVFEDFHEEETPVYHEDSLGRIPVNAAAKAERESNSPRKIENFEDLKGVTVHAIEVNSSKDRMTFSTDAGTYALYHHQDCCESVELNDICGELDDLLGSPLLMAEEVSNSDSIKPDVEYGSFTWTFYKLATIKGSVTLRWLGTSNGYYSESVSFEKVV